MSTFFRTLTLNDYTAKVSFETALTNGQLDWTIELSTGGQDGRYTTTTGGLAAITPSAVQTDKERHCTYLRAALNDIDTAVGREAKALGVKMLYDYLVGDALEFTKNHPRFKDTVIAKGYELKVEAPERYSMVASINRVLTALDAPLIKPYGWVPTAVTTPAPVAPPAAAVAQPTATVAAAPKPVNTAVQPPAPVAPKPDTTEADIVLFKAVATRLKCESVLRAPKEYFGYWQGAVKRGYYNLLPSKAASMEAYMAAWWCTYNDEWQRANLMKDLFTKQKLIWSEEVMPMYYEWEKTYTPTGRTNRYKKMCAFLDKYRAAFTAPA
jgi:hypothetical protein